jgi:tricorn protease
VTPIADESDLREVVGNRSLVSRLSGGTLGYTYILDTGRNGYLKFIQYHYAQIVKAGMTIDLRFNRGGQWATDLLQYLQAHALSATRFPNSGTTQLAAAMAGPKVFFNEFTISGGEALAWYGRTQAIGPLVGARTWGGLIGTPADIPPLIDATKVTIPGIAFGDASGPRPFENRGIEPDIKGRLGSGGDAQFRGSTSGSTIREGRPVGSISNCRWPAIKVRTWGASSKRQLNATGGAGGIV